MSIKNLRVQSFSLLSGKMKSILKNDFLKILPETIFDAYDQNYSFIRNRIHKLKNKEKSKLLLNQYVLRLTQNLKFSILNYP